MENLNYTNYEIILESLALPLSIAQKEGLELEFITSLCINLIGGEKDIQVAANDALCEWDM